MSVGEVFKNAVRKRLDRLGKLADRLFAGEEKAATEIEDLDGKDLEYVQAKAEIQESRKRLEPLRAEYREQCDKLAALKQRHKELDAEYAAFIKEQVPKEENLRNSLNFLLREIKSLEQQAHSTGSNLAYREHRIKEEERKLEDQYSAAG